MEPYDAVFIGFPIWWYVEPRIVDTFLESCDLLRKNPHPLRHLRRQRHQPGGEEPGRPLPQGRLEKGKAPQWRRCRRLAKQVLGL